MGSSQAAIFDDEYTLMGGYGASHELHEQTISPSGWASKHDLKPLIKKFETIRKIHHPPFRCKFKLHANLFYI